MEDPRLRASSIAIATVVFMIAIKLGAGLSTGSISIISQAVDSITDLLATVLALYAVRKSMEPPDALHPYGHSKVENLVSVIVGLLIIFAAVAVAREAAQARGVMAVAVWSISSISHPTRWHPGAGAPPDVSPGCSSPSCASPDSVHRPDHRPGMVAINLRLIDHPTARRKCPAGGGTDNKGGAG